MAFILIASAAHGAEIGTAQWGTVWQCPTGMASAVSATNTPGSSSFAIHRFAAPAAYAFLDGFDTRVYHTETVTEDDGLVPVPVPQVTNVTHRFLHFAEITNRVALLRACNPYGDEYRLNDYGLWSWSGLVQSGLLANSEHAFSFKTDVFGEIYAADRRTGWLPAFRAFAPSAAFPVLRRPFRPHPASDPGLVWDMISAVSFKEPAYVNFYVGVTNGSVNATPLTFDAAMSAAFGDGAMVPGITNATRRHVVGTLCAADQALSLYDQTVKVDYPVYIITNETKTYYRVTTTAEGELSGNVTVTKDARGYHFGTEDLSMSITTVDFNEASVVSNYWADIYAPYLRITHPTAGMAVIGKLNRAVRNWYISVLDPALTEAISGLWSHPYDEESFTFSGREAADGGAVYLDIINEDGDADSLEFLGGLVEEGSYGGTVRMVLNGTFRVDQSGEPDVYAGNKYEDWTGRADFRDNLEFIFLSCYASAYRTSVGDFTDARGLPTATWANKKGYGYSATFYDMVTPAQYKSCLMSELVGLMGKMQTEAGLTSDAAAYIGIGRNGAESIASQMGGWECAVGVRWFDQGAESSVIYIVTDLGGGEYLFEDIGGNEMLSIHVFSSGVNLFPSSTDIGDYHVVRDAPQSFDSRIRSATRATWAWPQVRIGEGEEGEGGGEGGGGGGGGGGGEGGGGGGGGGGG